MHIPQQQDMLVCLYSLLSVALALGFGDTATISNNPLNLIGKKERERAIFIVSWKWLMKEYSLKKTGGMNV